MKSFVIIVFVNYTSHYFLDPFILGVIIKKIGRVKKDIQQKK